MTLVRLFRASQFRYHLILTERVKKRCDDVSMRNVEHLSEKLVEMQ